MPETSLPPPPPKNHGGAAFVGAVIVMLLAMGGLLYWKFAGKETASLPPPPPSATTTAQLDEPPPPPPPDEPDSGLKPASTKKRVIVSSTGGGCSGTCNGEAPFALRSALSGAAGSVRGCYERALRQNQMLQGRMEVAVRVGAHGNSCSANIVTDSLGDPSVASCVLQKFRSGQFPAPSGGCVDVKVPISFMPKTSK